MACPIYILEVGSYRRRNKGTGTASCSVILEVVMTLHLSRVKRLCLVSPHPNKQSSARVQKEVESESEIFAFPCVSYSVTPHLLGLAPLARGAFGLTAGRLQICGGDIYRSTSLKQVCWKGGFVIFHRISRGIFGSASPRGEHLDLSKMQIVKKCCAIHLANEKPTVWNKNYTI